MDKPSKYNSNDFFVKIGDAINNLFDVAPGELINNADGIEELIKLNVNSAEDDHAYAFSVFNDDILKNFYQFLLVADDDVNDGHDPRRDSNLNISLLYLIDKCDKYINNVESGRIVSDNFLNFTYNIYKMAKDIHNSIRKQTLAESVLSLMIPFLEKDEDRLHKIYGASRIKGYSAKEFADYLRGRIIAGAVKAGEETIREYDRHNIMDDIRKALEGRYSEMLKWGKLDDIRYDANRLREYINKGNKIDNVVSQAERKAVEKFERPLNDTEKENLRSNIEWLIDVAANYPKELITASLQKRGDEREKSRMDIIHQFGLPSTATDREIKRRFPNIGSVAYKDISGDDASKGDKASADDSQSKNTDVEKVETEVALDNWIKTNYMGFRDIYQSLSDEEKKIVDDLPNDKAVKYLLKKSEGSMLYGRNKFDVDDAASLYDK